MRSVWKIKYRQARHLPGLASFSVVKATGLRLWAVVLLCLLSNCSEQDKSPNDPETLAKIILAEPDSPYKENLAQMAGKTAVREQLNLGRSFEQQAKLKHAYYWYRIAEEHGSRPASLWLPAHKLYHYSRTEDRETGEGLLAYHRSTEAAYWQSLVGDDYELSDISQAEKWWDLAEKNGYKGPRNKHYFLTAWVCRHWLMLLFLSAAGTAFFRFRSKSEPSESPASEQPQPVQPSPTAKNAPSTDATQKKAVPTISGLPRFITVPLKRMPGKDAKLLFAAPAKKHKRVTKCRQESEV